MGCRSDYLDPTASEKNSREVATHLVYVNTKLKKDVPELILKAANDIYGNPSQLQNMVVELCDTITRMTKKQRETIVYNAHDKQARDLASWWEEHEAADKKRLEKEAREKRDAKLVASAESKLDPEELAAIKRTYKP